MLSDQLAVDPDRGCMKHGLKLQADSGIVPVGKRVESAPIPRDSPKIRIGRIDLPGVGHDHFMPVGC